MPDFSEEPYNGDPFAQAAAEPTVHQIMPEQERVLGGSEGEPGEVKPVPMLGGGGAVRSEPSLRTTEPAAPVEKPAELSTPAKAPPAEPPATLRLPISEIEHGEFTQAPPAPPAPGKKPKPPGPIEAIAPQAPGDKWMVYQGSPELEAARLAGETHVDVKPIGTPWSGTETPTPTPVPAPRLEQVSAPLPEWRQTEAPPPIGHNMPPPEFMMSPGEMDRISTAVPTSVRIEQAGIDPHSRQDMNIGFERSDASRNTNAFGKNADLIRTYRATGVDPALSDEQVVEQFIQHGTDNILRLYDDTPAEYRDRSAKWYEGANQLANNWAQEFNLTPGQVAGVIAAQSPQKDWFQNVSLARRVLEISRDQGDYPVDADMVRWAQNYMARPETSADTTQRMSQFLTENQGKTLNEMDNPMDRAHFIRLYDEAHNPRSFTIYTPEGEVAGPALTQNNELAKVGWGSLRDIGKAASVLQDGSRPNISAQMGGAHKVRSFHNNIISPFAPQGDTTIDTHAAAAANLYPLSGEHDMTKEALGQKGAADSLTGSQGLYGLYHEMYRRAANLRGQIPRAMQSIVWDTIRNLFPAELKSGKPGERFTALIERIWSGFHNGLTTLKDAQKAVIAAAGGIKPPDWARGIPEAVRRRFRPAGHAEAWHPVDEDELP